MIGNDNFVACFGIVPAGDEEERIRVARAAIRHGFAIVPIAPGTKVPICTLNARAAKLADQEAREAARVAGRRNWERVEHDCGIAHALTDVEVATRVLKRLLKERGPVNLGVEVGRSRMVMVDADTAEQVAGFLADWSAESGLDLTGHRPTVSTPGLMRTEADGEENWVHKDGGHFWFTVPDDLDLTALPGPGTFRAESGWVAVWRDHQALVPPSARPEGPYVITGQVEPAPEFLLDRIQIAAHSHAERKARQQEKVRHDGDPIDIWSAATEWGDLLEPDGWTNTGLPDRCGCPIWTRPGNPAHAKSATAHELGCTHFDTEDGGHGPLHLWTDEPPAFLAEAVAALSSRTITKLQYLAWRDHDGHAGAAMAELELSALGGEDEGLTEELEAMLDAAAAPVSPAPADPPALDPAPEAADPVEDLAPPEGPEEIRALLAANPKLAKAVKELHLRDRAREVYDRIRSYRDAGEIRERNLASLDRLSDLPEDDEEELWRIDGLWQQGQVVLLSAKYKAGKTTMVLNVVRSLVDGKPFLGQFDATPLTGNLLIVNAEMTRRQFRKWLRESPIENPEKVYAFHVREAGPSSGDILDPTRRDEIIHLANEVNAQALILDPLNPLLSSAGVEENASSEVARWFTALADVIERSCVQDVFLVHHFGHVAERGRGSSKFMDAPDALWTYTVEEPGKPAEDDADDLLGQIEPSAAPRYLSAMGRDVELAKSRVDFDPGTRTLTMPVRGAGPDNDRAASRAVQASRKREQMRTRVLDEVRQCPGISIKALHDVVGGRKETLTEVVNLAIENGQLNERAGMRGARCLTVSDRQAEDEAPE